MSMRVRAALVIMAVVFVFTAASFVLSLSFTQRHMTETIEQELSLALDIADTVITTKISLLKSNAETLATRLNALPDDEIAGAMEAYIDDYIDFIALALYDENGAIAYTGELMIIPEPEVIRQAFAGESYLSSAHFNTYDGSSNGSFIINIYVPMSQNRVLTAAIDGMHFSRLLSVYRLWQTGSIFIVDRHGTFMASSRSDLVLGQRNLIDDAETVAELESAGEFYRNMISTEGKSSGSYIFEGMERICVYKKVTGSKVGWYIGVTAPLRESPLRNLQSGLMYSALFLLAAGAVVSILVSGIAITPFKTIEMQAEQIKEEHDRTSLLLDTMPLSCCLIDENSNVFRCNEGTVRLFELKSRDEFLDHFYEFSPKYQPDGRLSYAAILDCIKKAFTDGMYVCEWLHQKRDGTPIPTEVALIRIIYDNDYVVAAYVRDLREYKRMLGEIEAQAEKIREANEHTTLLLDAMPLACNLWDSELNVFGCNAENIRLFGVKDEQEFLDHFDELSPEYQPDGYPSKNKAEFVRRAFEEGRCVFEWMHQRRDGTPIPSEVTLVRVAYGSGYAVAGYVRDLREHKRMIDEIEHNNRLINIVNQAANILLQSDSDIFEENLCKCMAMIGTAVSADRVCIWKNKTVGGRLYCDLVYDWPGGAGSLINKNVAIDVSYDDNTPGWEEILSGGKCINTSISRLSPEEQVQLEAHGVKSLFVAPVFVRGEFWGYVGFDDYVNEKVFAEDEASTLLSGSLLIANALVRNDMMLSLREASGQLETALNDATRANAAKSSFLANMSHEMRTPLNAIIGLTDLALGNEKLDEDSFMNLEKINGAGLALLSTVNDILDISKIEAGKFELVPAVYDLPSLINDTVTQSIMHKGEKLIDLVLDLEGDLPAKLCGDELRIKQILNNLLSNAFKYTKEGTVRLGIRCDSGPGDAPPGEGDAEVKGDRDTGGDEAKGDRDVGGVVVKGDPGEGDTVWVKLYVKDTGIGIRPENLAGIFDDYSQTDTLANRRIMGTGLGLSITKRMVELMAGSISVESEYGKGSVFSVELPQKYVGDLTIGVEMADNLKNFQYYEQKRRQNSKLARIRLPYARVLVVDDVATNLDVAKGLMKPYGMQIDCVVSGQEAIDAIRDEKVIYNAVFMDHMMPGMDGIEATRLIREIGTDYAKAVPVIALTANAITGNEEMFLSKGFQAFISKPIELARLDAVIRQWVRDKEQEKLFFDKLVNVGGNIITDARKGADRRSDSDRRNGLDRRVYGKLYGRLDIKKGLKRFGDNEETYLGVLRSYAVNTKPLIEKIKTADTDDPESYAISVHGLKGSSRGIFADVAGDKAEALENAAKEGDVDFIRKNNQSLIDELEDLIAVIEDALEKMDEENPKPVIERPDKESLEALLDACRNYDMDSVDAVMEELEQYEYASGGELIAWLRENVDEADFSSIIEKLSEQ